MKKLSIILILITCTCLSAQDTEVSYTQKETISNILQTAQTYVQNLMDKGIILSINIDNDDPIIYVREDIWDLSKEKIKKTLINTSAIYILSLCAKERSKPPEMLKINNKDEGLLGAFFYSDHSSLIVQ